MKGEFKLPTETRAVSFTNAEVIEALEQYCERTKRPLPSSGIKDLTFSNGKEIGVTITPNGSAPAIHFGENEIAVALIVFCNKKGIPIARRALKSLQVLQDSVSLHLAIRS